MTRRPPARQRTTTPPGPARSRGLGGDQVEGIQAVRELLVAGRRRVHEVWIARVEDERLPVALADIVELAADQRVPVRYVGRTKLSTLTRTEAPQGVVARAATLPEADLADLARRGRNGQPPFLLAVDGVTDPGNLGALLRAAECNGVSGVVLPRHRAVHVTPAVAKSAAGAIEYLPLALVPGLPAAVEQLKATGVWVVGLDGSGDTPIDRLPVADESVCLVVGSEGSGLSTLVRRRCDVVAAIPLRGRLASLNVAAAGAIACYEVSRRRPR